MMLRIRFAEMIVEAERFTHLITSSDQLWQNGMACEVSISLSRDDREKRLAEGREVPPPMLKPALIDTGARSCVVDEAIIPLLEPTQAWFVHYSTPASPKQRYPAYRLDIFLDGIGTLEVEAAAMPINMVGTAFIIGRDVLQRGVLVYDGLRGEARFSLNRSETMEY